MICWRTHRKPLIALVCILTAFILLQGPMESMIKELKVDDSSFIGTIITKKDQDVQTQILPSQSKRLQEETGRVGSDDGGSPQAADEHTPALNEPIVKPKKATHWQIHMKRQCERMGTYNPLSERNFDVNLFKHIIVDDKHKVIYCQIPKVATITWRRIFIISTGQANTTDPKALAASDIYGKYDQVLQYLSDLTPADIKYKLQHYFKFLFVREPMERLLSAFRNKMVSKVKSSDFFRLTLGKKIAKEYRPLAKGQTVDAKDPDVQFSEFVQYLTDEHRTVPWNEHWDQYHRLCFPCTIPYDFVGKLENAQRDANFVLKKTGLSRIALFPNRTAANYKSQNTKYILEKYYSTLAVSDLRNLVKAYELDRRLFGYKLPQVIHDRLSKL